VGLLLRLCAFDHYSAQACGLLARARCPQVLLGWYISIIGSVALTIILSLVFSLINRR
jgi:hypothetical protein